MKNIYYIIFTLFLFGFSACNKDAAPIDCFNATGKLTEEKRSITSFKNVILRNNVNLFLKSAVSNTLVVEAGKNLLSKIVTEVDDKGNLIISNNNTCNWVRSYEKPVNVYLECSRFDTLFYASIGDVTNMDGADTLDFGSSFNIEISEGAGSFNLNVKSDYLWIVFLYGTCDVNITGVVKSVSAYSSAWGRIDFSSINCENAWALNNSSNDMFLRCSEKLQASTEALGDIYIAGHPPNISFNRQGEGDLIIVP